MQKLYCLFFLLIINISIAFATQTKVKSLRIHTTADNTRLVFDLTAIPKHQIFQLTNPDRLVIDLKNTSLEKEISLPASKSNLLKGLRSANKNKYDTRIVFDLQDIVTHKSFVLQANSKYGPRLVIDLPLKHEKSTAHKETKFVKTFKREIKPFIVAVDAGHGGKDPGAHGRHGTLEKNVVFEIAQKLTNLLNKQQGIKAIMVRKGDYFIPLRQRIKIAREANADLFLSIHADAVKNSTAAGASVYTLSRDGASSEAARWLADSENAADLIGGIPLHDKDDVLASVLLDLSQTSTQNISQSIAKDILENFSQIGKLHSEKVQKAGFVVLMSPDIPSILVETAYISNPKEEKKLQSGGYQIKLAKAIKEGVLSYAENVLASNNTSEADVSMHKISKGETLSGIALQYGVSLDELKKANNISKVNNIKAGQMLAIPVGI